MPHFFKVKYTLPLLILGVLLLISNPKPAFAQGVWYSPLPTEHFASLKECDSGNVGLECTVNAVVFLIFNALGFGGGGDPTLSNRPGAVHFAGAMVGKIVTSPPVSSGHYIQYMAQRINPAQPAYAQGTGYRALEPLIPVWSAFRNVAYLAFVVIFILIGFMIMFRARLDPQTAVNVQNSLPKLVITLLLITFSYALAGLMVDLIYLGIYLLVSVFASQGLIGNPDTARTALLSQNMWSLVFQGGIWRAQDTLAADIQQVITSAVDPNLLTMLLGSSLANALIHVIFIFAILFSTFKLFFQLLIAYISIIISTLFAPILILFNALPGSQSFGTWVRNFLANVLVFPAVAGLFMVASIIMGPCPAGNCPFATWEVNRSLYRDQSWLPPFIGFSADTNAVLALLGYGFILFAPQMVSVLQKAFQAQPLPVAGVFAPIAAGTTIVTGVAGAPFRAAGGAIRGVAGGVVGGFTQQVGEIIGGERRYRGPR